MSAALQPSICGEPAEEQVDMDPGGPQGSSVSVCTHLLTIHFCK